MSSNSSFSSTSTNFRISNKLNDQEETLTCKNQRFHKKCQLQYIPYSRLFSRLIADMQINSNLFSF